MTVRVQKSSSVYLFVPVGGPSAGELTAAALSVSWTGNAGPWHPVALYVPPAAGSTTGQAAVLVGPGTANGALPLGLSRLYVRVISNPEQPVLPAGTVYVE